MRKQREQHGFSQDELAFLFGNQSGTKISRYEHARIPRLETLIAYEQLFGVTLQHLYGDMCGRIKAAIEPRAIALKERLETMAKNPDIEKKIALLDRFLESAEYRLPNDETGSGTTRILAIDPSNGRFGFAVIEETRPKLTDSGVVSCKEGQCLEKAKAVIEQYQPHVLALENCDLKDSRRRPTAKRLIRNLRAYAKKARIRTPQVTPRKVAQALGIPEKARKDEIAKAIAELFPELEPKLIARRVNYAHEHYRTSIFDAVALANAALSSSQIKPRMTIVQGRRNP